MNPLEDKIKIVRLQLRRKHLSLKDEIALLHDIGALGDAIATVMPDILVALERGLFRSVGCLVPIVVRTKNTRLFDALKRNRKFSEIDVSHKIELFLAGFSEFQGELLAYLREIADCDDNYMRRNIVEAFAESGTMSLLQDLKDIEALTSLRLAELEMQERTTSEDDQILHYLKAGSRRQFLITLRHAINRVSRRPDLNTQPKATILSELSVTLDGQDHEKASSLRQNHRASSGLEIQAFRIHTVVAQNAQRLLDAGEYFHAVFEAAKAYEKAVAEFVKSNKYGVQLMQEAFGDRGAVRMSSGNSQTDKNVQEGIRSLSIGLMQAVRNPAAHELAVDWPMSRDDALHVLGMISFLFNQLDKAKNADI